MNYLCYHNSDILYLAEPHVDAVITSIIYLTIRPICVTRPCSGVFNVPVQSTLELFCGASLNYRLFNLYLTSQWQLCYLEISLTCWVIFSHKSSSGSEKGVSSLIVSSLGSSRMPPVEMEEVVEVFLDEEPAEMPESVDSFLVKCLPTRTMSSCIIMTGLVLYNVPRH